MSVAELSEAAIADLRRQGYDPAVLVDESCVRTFAELLQLGSRNWDLVADVVSGTPPDVELAGRVLRTKPTREERVGQAQQQAARFVADVAATVVLFNDTFGIDRRQP